MNKYLNRNSGLVVISLTVIAILVFGIHYNSKSEKPTDRIRIKQTVDTMNFLDKFEYVLKTEIFVNDKLTIGETDFGTFEEIDNLKCIRYCEAKQKIINLNKLRNKKCN